MEFWFLMVIFILGLCCGSFVNMLVYRTAIAYGLLKVKKNPKYVEVKKSNTLLKSLGGRSFCDYCGQQLKWYENIPVVSWIIQGGKTRCCHKKLSLLYPIVEITVALLFLIFNFQNPIFNEFINSQIVIQFLFGLIIIVFLVFSTVFDLKYMILPDFSTVFLLISVLITQLMKWNTVGSYGLAAVGSFGFLEILYLITKGRGMGFGDVKLALFMGLFLGYPKILIAMYVAFIFGALVGLFLMVIKKINKKTMIPFGPFLIFGTMLAWFWGEKILKWSVFHIFGLE